jgi:hypothetical protein
MWLTLILSSQFALRTQLFPGLNTRYPKYQMGLVIDNSFMDVGDCSIICLIFAIVGVSDPMDTEKEGGGRPFPWD